MKLQKELTELGKSRIQQWRTILDELEVQLALGKAEVKDIIAQEKKNISTYLETQKAFLNEKEYKTREQYLELKGQLEDLFHMLLSDMTTSKRSYNRSKKETLQLIHKLEYEIKKRNSMFEQLMGEDLDDLKAKLDAYRIRLALSTFENVNETIEEKKQLREELHKLMEMLSTKIYPKEDKVSHFMDEISESFEHLKRAFAEILN